MPNPASASIEGLESRSLLTVPAAPTLLFVDIAYQQDPDDATTIANVKFTDTNVGLLGTSYRLQWTEYGNAFPDINDNLLTTNPIANNRREAFQVLDAAQRRLYRVRAENGGDVSAWVEAFPITNADSVLQTWASADANGIHLHWTQPLVPRFGKPWEYYIYRKLRTDSAWPTQALNHNNPVPMTEDTYTDPPTPFQLARRTSTASNAGLTLKDPPKPRTSAMFTQVAALHRCWTAGTYY